MGRLPRRTSAHISLCTPQEQDIIPEDWVHLEPRSTTARRSTPDSEHHHIAEIMISLRSSGPTCPARSRPRPINDEDFQGNFPLTSETSLPPRRRRRVQEEPPVCPVNNGAHGILPAPRAPTAEQVLAYVDQAIKNDEYREVHRLSGRAPHPFTTALRSIVLPRAVLIPPTRPYRGQGDPFQHVQRHEASLLGRGALEDHLALLFPATLVGPASRWFFDLPHGSVTSWQDLRRKFLQRYWGEISQLEDPPALDDMQQDSNGTLVEYYAKYNRNLAEGEIARAFRESLPRSATGQVSGPAKATYGIQNTKFTRELSVILAEMRNLELDTPPPVREEGILIGNNVEQWCDYHKCRGHHTDNCFRLRYDVEGLIRNGKLLQFIPDNKRPSTEAQAHPLPEGKGKEKMEYDPHPPDTLLPPRPVKHIGVISGGFASGGTISNRRDVYVTQVGEPAMTGNRPATRPQEAITFSDADMEHVTFPHDDALVVTLMTNGYGLRRILIDGGSSADIMFKDAFLALGFQLRDLRPADVPLTGFSGATIRSLGSITLPVTFGSGATSVRTPITFLVVDAPATYNAIIGRTTLHSLRIIPSTVHQKMKFWTPNGVGEVRGDQAASRSCYVNALRRGGPATATPPTVISDPSRQ